MKTSTAPLRHSPAAMHTAIGVLIQSHIIIDAISLFLVSEFERGLKVPLVMTYVHVMQNDREQTHVNYLFEVIRYQSPSTCHAQGVIISPVVPILRWRWGKTTTGAGNRGWCGPSCGWELPWTWWWVRFLSTCQKPEQLHCVLQACGQQYGTPNLFGHWHEDQFWFCCTTVHSDRN